MTIASRFLINTGVIGNETPDEELVRRILGGAANEFAALMDRHSQRLYRVCRSVVANDAEAEAALQAAYLRAYRHLGQFRGDSKFVTWLTKIAIYEALALRRTSSTAPQEPGSEPRIAMRPMLVSKQPDPGEELLHRGHGPLLEKAIDSLPPNYRTVFVLRHIEELSAEDTAACLLLSRETVETRLMHSRRMLQERLRAHALDQPAEHVFPYRNARCIGLIGRVMKAIM